MEYYYPPEDAPPGPEEEPEDEEEEEQKETVAVIQPTPVLLSRRPPHLRARARSPSIPPPRLESASPPPSPPPPPLPHPAWVARRLRPLPPESLSLGGDWWSLVRFVREIEAACTMPNQFDFDSYRTEQLTRPTTSQMPELRRFLEYFGQIGFYVVWCWQRVCWEREQKGLSPYSLWQIIDNRSLLTQFVAMIQLHFTGSADDRGVKDPGRAGVRAREKQKLEVLLAFLRAPSDPPRDEQVIAQDASLQKDAARPVVPPRRAMEPLEERIAAKHLLVKWCAQACGVNTATAPYRLPEERSDAEVQHHKRIKHERSEPNDEVGVPEPLLRDILNNSNVRAGPAAPGLLPVSRHVRERDIRAARVARDAARPRTVGLVEQALAQMDVNVLQMYRQGIENLRSFSTSSSSSEDLERNLLTQSTLRDQVFFAEYCSILNAQFRGHTHRSRLSGVVRNRLSKEWVDLQAYFQRWAVAA